MRILHCFILVLLMGSVALAAAVLCRYTVRDIGFIDLGDPQWTLVLHGGDSDLQIAAEAVVQDSNIRIDQRKSSGDRVDDVWLEDQAGRVHHLPSIDGGTDFQRLLPVVQSPVRKAIAEAAIDRFAVIVQIDGEDTPSNARAAEAIESALDLLRELDEDGSTLPRRIGALPEVLVVSATDDDDVLRWSLGLPATGMQYPAVAIFYGRSKLAGEVLRGPGLTAEDVLDQLAVVGLSCECDQARDWASLPSLPGRWTSGQHDAVVDQLGFDPGHPMVIAEVQRILQRGLDAPSVPTSSSPGEDLLLGYSEEVSIQPIQEPAREREARASTVENVPTLVDGSDGEDDGASMMGWVWIVLGLIFFVGTIGGVVILVGSRS